MMQRWLLIFTALLVSACSTSPGTSTPPPASNSNYPATEYGNTEDNYHGQSVADPYQWMESLNSPQVKQWVVAQNETSRAYLNRLAAGNFVKQRITELWNVQQTSAPTEHGGKLFYWHNDGLQSQPTLYYQESIEAAPQVVINPNSLSPQGNIAVTNYRVSPNGRYVAYELAENGTDWTRWRIRDLNTERVLSDTIEGTKFTELHWYPDSRGFYYSRYPKVNGQFDDTHPVSVFYHKLGTSTAADTQVTTPQHEGLTNPYPVVTDDGRFLLLRVQRGPNHNQFYYRPLRKVDAPFRPLVTDTEGELSYLGSRDDWLFFHSTGDTTGFVLKVNSQDSRDTQRIIPATDKALESASLFGDQIIAQYLDDVQSRVVIFDTQGTFINELALPGMGSVSGFNGDTKASQTFFKYASFTEPGKIYRYQVAAKRTTLWRQSSLPIDSDRYHTEQVFAEADDGTAIPLFLIHDKTVERDGNNPTLLHVYGGFGYSLTPNYNPKLMAWLELGGSVAIANVRGGGEYGSAWHQAATGVNKSVAISDLQDSAQWLIEQNYTKPSKLALYGRGHGALLVSAAMIEQPKRYAAAVPEVGLYDMLRYQHDNANALGWQSEFGVSSRAEDFAALIDYSPIHNVEAGSCYPATLISTGLQDQRVAPWHSYKLTATLQRAQQCDEPILLKATENAGHGTKNPTWMQVELASQQWLFLVHQLQFEWLKNTKAQ